MPADRSIVLRLRGRGVRPFDVDAPLLVSAQGHQPPRLVDASQVRAGDFVAVPYGGRWRTLSPAMPILPDRALYGSEKSIRVPERLTSELAFLLGAYLSEGHTTSSNWSVIITNSVIDVLERVREAWGSLFGLNARVTTQPGKCPGIVVSSKRLVEYLQLLGCGSRAANKAIPSVLMDACQPEVLAFLQGVALDAYTTHRSGAKWAICLESASAIDQLQDVLTRLGVVNAQIPKHNKKLNKTYYELYAAGAWGQQMCRLVPFLEPNKAARAAAYLELTYGPGATDVVPGIGGRDLYAMVPVGRSGRRGKGSGRQALTYLRDRRTNRVTRTSVERALAAGAALPTWLNDVIAQDVRFAEVVELMPASVD